MTSISTCGVEKIIRMGRKLMQVVWVVNDAALIKSEKTLRANEKAANEADQAVKKYGTDAQKAGDQASKSFLNLGNIWKGLIGIGIIAFFTNLTKKAIDLGIKQEQLNIAFSTFLGSAEKARKLLEQLNKFALVTPFTPDQVNKAAQALLAFGVAGTKVIPTLKILGDVSAGTGKDLTEMAIIFGQIRSTGRLMGQDLLQLINAGFNPLQIISEKTGQSVKILKQEMEKGNISFEMVEQAFIDATSAGGLFFNLMEKQSQTIGGVLSTIEGNFDEFLKNLFAAETGPMKRFTDLLERFSRGLLLFSLTEDQVIAKGNEMVKDDFKAKFLVFAEGFKTIDDAAKEMNASLDESIARLDKDHRSALIGGTEEEANTILRNIEVKKQQKIAIQELIGARDEEAKAAETKKLQQRLEAEAIAAKKLNERLKELEKTFKDTAETPIEEGDQNKGIWGMTLDDLESYGDAIMAEIQSQVDSVLQIQHDADVAEIENEKKKQDRIKDLKRQAFDFGLDLIYQFVEAQINANDMVFERETRDFDKRIEAAGNNERAKQEIRLEQMAFNEEQDKKQEAFEIAKANKDKERIIKEMILQGVLNSVRALGNPPVPNFLAAGLTAAATAAQLGIAKGIGFKEGVIDLQGPGTGTSDSIPARLSRGESVITADATAHSMNLLEAIQDRKIDDRILYKINPAASGGSRMDMSGVEKKLDDVIEALPDYYERGMFVNKVVTKQKQFKQHSRSKYFG